MNFLKAIQHATIGYGIRRKPWSFRENCYLVLKLDELYWAEGNCGGEAKLCPDKPDLTVDLLPEDIAAKDWETI